jgi:hypothetical protein
MATPAWWQKLKELIRMEWHYLTMINKTDRVWQMPVAHALASGLPLLIAAYFDHLNYGLVASLGGMVFLYLPTTPMSHRMVLAMAAAFGMIACYTLGLMSHFFPAVMTPMLIFTTILVTMVVRFYAVGVPGNVFFVMAAAIGAYTPVDPAHVPFMVGLLAMGSLLAVLIGFFYSIYILRLHPPKPVPPLPAATFDYMVFDPVIIGIFAGISLAVAQALGFEKAYWVPVSCVIVMQGASLRAVWNKQLQRMLGTGVGMLLAWGIFLLPLNKWSIVAVMMVLSFIVEFVVMRHYALAAVFITPSAILLVEAGGLGQIPVGPMIQARFVDIVTGCIIGLIGGICLHSVKFREVVGRPMRWLIPARFMAG